MYYEDLKQPKAADLLLVRIAHSTTITDIGLIGILSFFYTHEVGGPFGFAMGGG